MNLRAPKTPTFVEISKNSTLKEMFGGEIQTKKNDNIIIARLAKSDFSNDYLWEHVKEDETLLTNGWWVNLSYVKPIKVPKLDKNRRALLVKDSEWKVNEDMMIFLGTIDVMWGCQYAKETINQTILAGTKVKVKNPKTKKVGVIDLDEPCCKVEVDNTEYWMPVRFFGGMDCVKEGKEKTYWKLLDGNGSPVRTKRYQTLNAVKGAVKIITGTVNEETGPWWVDGSASAAGFTVGESDLENFHNWVAVEYSAKDDKEIYRMDLGEWFTMTILKEK